MEYTYVHTKMLIRGYCKGQWYNYSLELITMLLVMTECLTQHITLKTNGFMHHI